MTDTFTAYVPASEKSVTLLTCAVCGGVYANQVFHDSTEAHKAKA